MSSRILLLGHLLGASRFLQVPRFDPARPRAYRNLNRHRGLKATTMSKANRPARALRRLTSTSRPLYRANGLSSIGSIRQWTTVTTLRDGLTVHALKDATFPYVWLRDSCQGPASVHPSTMQKLHRSSDIPIGIKPVGVQEGENIALTGVSEQGRGVKVTQDGLSIQWADGNTSFYHRDFLNTHSTPANLQEFHLARYTSPVAWTPSSIEKSPNLFIPYLSLLQQDFGRSTSKPLVDAMTQLLRYGLVFVTGVPTDGKTNAECALKNLAERFGEIRNTFYGELWDVINISNSKNIAYTNLDLGLHMDLLYFQHPPRFQALHCLRNRVVGGTSIFVDALKASQTLFHANREHFGILSRTPVAFQYLNDGHHLYMQHPTIQLEHAKDINYSTPPSSSASLPSISHINYSPPFQGPLPLSTPPEFYSALKHFSEILNGPENTYTYTLREGDCVLFDNRRVLHARTAFHETGEAEGIRFGKGEETTNRWLKGCYLEADAVADRMRIGRRDVVE